jgi:hypothetical protein
MTDGIKIFYPLQDFKEWKKTVDIELFTATDLETGATKCKTRAINGGMMQTVNYTGKFETYNVTVKETTYSKSNNRRNVSYLLIIDGSLHKNHFSGENFSRFTWSHLQTELNKLETGLNIELSLAEIVNLEIGLNIPVPFPAYSFLDENLLSYKGKTFTPYEPDKDGKILGFVCYRKQYSVKLYDKAKQFNLPYDLMRFELRYLKMQTLKDMGIKKLSSLLNPQNINRILPILLTAWQNVLLHDNSIDLKNPEITYSERKLLKEGRNPKYWSDCKKKNRRQFNYLRNKFKRLVKKYGQGWPEKITELIKQEWQNGFKNCTNLPGGENPELYNLTVKVKGKNVQKRFCLSCGRDISGQNLRSKFCSAKFVGEAAAHQCRNKDSNRRNNLKNKIRRINSRGVLFDVTPYLKKSG